MFCIAWEYLTGRSVAKDHTDDDVAEWPPHPDRVFQALVAAWGETGQDQTERSALLWLEAQVPPSVHVPASADQPGGVVTSGAPGDTFVPANDVEGPRRGAYGDAMLAILPVHRKRSPRTFPSMLVGQSGSSLSWDALPEQPLAQALERLTARVTCVGHSRSLVRMWTAAQPAGAVHWRPLSNGLQARELSLRVPAAGRLDDLCRAHALGLRPATAVEHGYARAHAADAATGEFSDQLLVLRRVGGDVLTLQQAPHLAAALRGALMSHASPAAMAFVSGHAPDGTPLDRQHVAYLPLGFVGHPHADGHLLGLAVAFPATADPAAEDGLFRAVVAATNPETGVLRLNCGPVGCMEVVVEDRVQVPAALRSETWCRSAHTWSSVTPVVLDRMPPRRHQDQDGWAQDQLIQACVRSGLPEPAEVAILKTARLTGVAPAAAFPPLARKDGTRRWHTHVHLAFNTLIKGPLVLGAGRYRGYGLFKPLVGGTDQ